MKPRQRNAFNLIESAIVLGVVGLVIGGIWVGASAIYEGHKINKTVEGVFTIARNVQNLISMRDANQMGFVHITAQMKDSGVFPKDWNFGSEYKNPFSGKIEAYSYSNRFDLALHSIPRGACAKIVMNISSIGAMAGSKGSGSSARANLGYISINTTEISTFPVSLATAKTICNVESNRLIFTFGYTRTN